VRYISEISRGRTMNFIFDAAQQAAEDRHIRCPSTYRAGAQIPANTTAHFPHLNLQIFT